MQTRLQAADAFIKAKCQLPLSTPPKFHFSPPVGWINDPNGFSYYDGAYHLFYQYNPYDIIWNTIHWGHATTQNFINWEHHPVALGNDKIYDAHGCFSGSAIEKDGKLYLMYTGHTDPNLLHLKDESQIKQVQCVAVSDDGVNFEKLTQNPVIGEAELPDGYLICDFRDPKVWEEGGKYYCILASRNVKRLGEILMFVSDDLLSWQFHSSILKTEENEHTLLECPDYFKLGDKEVMLYSAMPCDPEYANQVKHRVCYAIGKLDYEAGQFIVEHEGLLDYGNSFYAPQTAEGEHQERLLLGWMQSWNQATPPDGFTFNGMMSLPRLLSISGNRLVQYPSPLATAAFGRVLTVEQLQLVEKESYTIQERSHGHLSIIVTPEQLKEARQLHIAVQDDGNSAIHAFINFEQAAITIQSDYSETKAKSIAIDVNKALHLDLFFDFYSYELFVNKGEQVFTTTSYLQKGQTIHITAQNVSTIKELTLMQVK